MSSEPPRPPFRLRDIVGLDLDTPIRILDIGAMAEGEVRYDALIRQGIAEVTGFEPNPEEIAKLKADRRDGCTWLPHVLGDGKPATFHKTRYPGCSSLFRPDPATIDLFVSLDATTADGNFTLIGTEEVETTRLDDVGECPAADYVKIDVQGSKLDVLRHGAAKISGAMVIEAEVEFVPIYESQPLFADLDAFMRDQGFLLHKFIDVAGRNFRPVADDNRFSATSQALWADAVFVRDVRRIGEVSPTQLLKGAVILHEVYCSYDLAHLLLYAHDLGHNTAYAPPYLEAIQAAPSLPRLYMNLKEST